MLIMKVQVLLMSPRGHDFSNVLMSATRILWRLHWRDYKFLTDNKKFRRPLQMIRTHEHMLFLHLNGLFILYLLHLCAFYYIHKMHAIVLSWKLCCQNYLWHCTFRKKREKDILTFIADALEYGFAVLSSVQSYRPTGSDTWVFLCLELVQGYTDFFVIAQLIMVAEVLWLNSVENVGIYVLLLCFLRMHKEL